MADVALVTVPDEGAADVVRAELVESAIPVRLERAYPEHPYGPTVLAAPWKVMVPVERLAEAQAALARIQHETAAELEAQALAAAAPEAKRAGRAPSRADEPADLPPRSLKVSWALALSIVLVFPVACFYARARRRGAVWMALFLATIALAVANNGGYQLFVVAADSPLSYAQHLVLLAIAIKLADMFVGMLLIALRGRAAARG